MPDRRKPAGLAAATRETLAALKVCSTHAASPAFAATETLQFAQAAAALATAAATLDQIGRD